MFIDAEPEPGDEVGVTTVNTPCTMAHELVHGPRAADYGEPRQNFDRIATGWEVIFGIQITERQVAQAMIWVKVARDIHRPTMDNLVDIAGYAETAAMVPF